jgi:hypothetical protein
VVVLAKKYRHRGPVVTSFASTKCRQLLWSYTAFGGTHDEISKLGGKSSRQQRRSEPLGPVPSTELMNISRKQLTDHEVLLRAGKQPGCRLSGPDCFATEQPECVRVKGPSQRFVNRTRESSGNPFPEVSCAPPAEREHEDAFRVDPVSNHSIDDGLNDGGGLACARTGKHAQWATAMGDHPSLLGVQFQRSDRCRCSPGKPECRSGNTGSHVANTPSGTIWEHPSRGH